MQGAATAVAVAKMNGAATAVEVGQLKAKGKMAKARMAKGFSVIVKEMIVKDVLSLLYRLIYNAKDYNAYSKAPRLPTQGCRPHFQEDGAMTIPMASIIKPWKKLSFPWIARHLQLPSI